MIDVVVSCEHAAWAVPATCNLGVPDHVLQSQAGWDPGAFDIAQLLAAQLDGPLVAGSYSRMFVDLNRAMDHVDVVPRHSYGADVPGNVGLDAAAIAARLAAHHTPYWTAVANAVDASLHQGRACVHLSSHSFCPQLDPVQRDFDVGVLFDPAYQFEAEIAERLLTELAALGLAVRPNAPYTGSGPALVTSLRAARGMYRYAGIEIETSHALVRQTDGCTRVANALTVAMQRVIANYDHNPRR